MHTAVPAAFSGPWRVARLALALSGALGAVDASAASLAQGVQPPGDAPRAVATGTGSPGPTEVLDIRIEGVRCSVLLRDASGRVLRDLSAAPLAESLGQPATPAPGGVRHIRIVGFGAGGPGGQAMGDDGGQLPSAYDPSRDPYVQYPELLDPNYYLSSPE